MPLFSALAASLGASHAQPLSSRLLVRALWSFLAHRSAQLSSAQLSSTRRTGMH
jgi:hypothetical protein